MSTPISSFVDYLDLCKIEIKKDDLELFLVNYELNHRILMLHRCGYSHCVHVTNSITIKHNNDNA